MKGPSWARRGAMTASGRWIGLALVWCGATAWAAPAGFEPGETLTYSFSVGIVEAGRARLAVGVPQRRRGERLVAIQAEAQSLAWLALFARLDDRYEVLLDADSLLPRRIVSREKGIRERTIQTEMAGSAATVRSTTSPPARSPSRAAAWAAPVRSRKAGP